MTLNTQQTSPESDTLYFCSACGLHYDNEAVANECKTWCDDHMSCNLDITRKSVEAQKAAELRQ